MLSISLLLALLLFTFNPALAQRAEDSDMLRLELTHGPVLIKLRADIAPKHVARIKQLVEQKFYDGHLFHRVIPGFMAQTGDPTGTGTGGSGQKLKAEFTNTPFKRGTLGMARSASPDSADSQFFICFGRAEWLDGKYTVIGEVVSGMEFVDKIATGEPPAKPDKIVSLRAAPAERK
jgi:peptidylprolyl isomerase